jgi:RsiW-degrading membrane proteinase PrsW (M82 family)
MNHRYQHALLALAAGLAATAWVTADPASALPGALILGSASVPLAVLFAIAGRLKIEPSWPAVFGGATIGVGVAIASHAVVFAFAYTFFLGFADSGASLLEALRIDPHLTTVLASPWTILLLVELVVVAPLTEEIGKALGARLGRPPDRVHAFMAGAAAGVGFAIVENAFYATGALWASYPWEALLIGRMLGGAIHPLASGLVFVAWWQYRNGASRRSYIRNFAIGAGVHALWNGALVALTVAATAFEIEATAGDAAVVSLAYAGAFGAIATAALWIVTSNIAAGRDEVPEMIALDGRVVAGWTVLAASLLLPVAVLIVAFPGFRSGG